LTARARIAVWAAALAGPLLTVPLIQRPTVGFALVALVAAVALAARSVAYPVALAGLPALVVGLTGSNPFPKGGITLLMFAWTMLAVLLAIVNDADGGLPLRLLASPALVLTVLLIAWLLVRLVGSPGYDYGRTKLQLFTFVNVAALVGGLAIGRSRRHFALFAQVMLALAVANSLVLAKQLAGGGAQQVAANRFVIASSYDPIGFGRAMGFGLLISIALLLSGSALWLRVTALASVPVLGLAIMASGSRGPVLGLVAGAVVLGACAMRSREARRRLLWIAPAAGVGGVLVTQLVPGQSITRVFSFLTGHGSDTRGEDRLALYHLAWRAFADHPLAGIGTGGFASIGGKLYEYPHNLLLEVGAELGLPGALLFLGLIGVGVVTALRMVRSGTRRIDASFALGLLVFAVLNSMFSGDITGNGDIWLAIGLATGMSSGRAAPQLRLRRRTTEAVEAPSTPPPVAPADTGAVTQPADGAAVAGLIRLAATPARTGWGVATVRLQHAREGERWQDIVAHDDAYDVIGRSSSGTEHVAVVKSRRLADAVVAALRGVGYAAVDVRPARSRPWERAQRAETIWDTRELEGGLHRLRAVTMDMTGALVASPHVSVVVDNVAPEVHVRAADGALAAEAQDDGSGIALVRFEGWRQGAWVELGIAREEPYLLEGEPDADGVRAVAVDRAGNEAASDPVDAQGRALPAGAVALMVPEAAAATTAATTAAPDAEMARWAAELAERERRAERIEQDVTRLEAERILLERQRGELEPRLRALEQREAELAGREARTLELQAATEAAAEHGRRLAEQAEHLDRTRAELDALRARLETDAQALQADGDAAAARERDLAAREQALAGEAEAAGARQRALQKVAEAAAQREQRLAEWEERLTRLQPEVARREQATADLDERLAALAGQERALEQREAALAEQATSIEARERALRKVAEAAAARERRLAERDEQVEPGAGAVAAAASAEQQRELEQRLAAAAAAEQSLEARRSALAKVAEAAAGREQRLAAWEERLARFEPELEQRAAELAERERVAAAEREEVLAARARALDEWERALNAREIRVRSGEVGARELPETPEPPAATVRAPAPEPEPVVVEPAPVEQPPRAVEPAPAPARILAPAGHRPVVLWELEHLIAERRDPDPYVQEEREAMLFHLRAHVGPDGAIPAQFDALVADVFGPVLER
jgi:O-antigen ligase